MNNNKKGLSTMGFFRKKPTMVERGNKKGLSTIVATLLIILLTLVAVGIIWVVIRNVVQGGTDQVNIDAKCIQSNVVATKVVSTTDNLHFNVTLSRQGGTDEIGGVKLVFTNADESASSTSDVPGNIAALTTVTQPVITDLANASKVSVVVYFLDNKGEEQLCSNSNPFEF
jgi:flagellar basal body-associated protein FliL